jgi:hypothetical protein
VVEAPVAGAEAGDIGVDEAQRAGTTGAGMSRDEIFREYPFLAPEGWKRYDKGDTGGDDFVEAPAAPVPAGVGQYGGLPAAAGSGLDFQGSYGMDIPSGIHGINRWTGGPEGPGTAAPFTPGYPVGNVNQALPRPGVRPSDMQPWERARAVDAFELEPWAGGIDFVPDEFVPPTTPPQGSVGGTIRAEDRLTAQEAIAKTQRDAAMREEIQEIADTPQFYDIPGYGPYDRPIDADKAEIMYSPYEYEESTPITPASIAARPAAPTPAPVAP